MAASSSELRFKTTDQALILGTTVRGGASSREAQAAARAGMAVRVVTPSEWMAMTATQFSAYRALIIGDAGCWDGELSAVQAAIDTRDSWGPAVSGNVFITASDPASNNTPSLVERGVEFAVAQHGTGLYLALGCAWQSAAPGTPVTLLEPFGAFTVTGVRCHRDAHMLATNPKELSADLYGADELLAGDGCAARSVFTHHPDLDFVPVALAVDSEGSLPGARPYLDPFWNEAQGESFMGTPYILARGVGPLPPPSSPPVAMCKDLTLEADKSCGADGSVDDGSSDPDDDLVGCTQSPEGPYPLGTTLVKLTCTDKEQQTSSCTAMVSVKDIDAPTLELNGSESQTLECGSPYVDPGATAHDFCDGDLSGAVVVSGAVVPGKPDSYKLTYDVMDSSGNSAPSVIRTVHVSDTLAPTLTVLGPLDDTLECGLVYVDPGATAMDLCAGDLTSVIQATRTGSPSQPGSFTITYSVTDPSGNSASSPVPRKVTVVDQAPPVLTRLGPASLQLECGSPYNDPGATAADQCFGDLTHLIQLTGSVDTGTPGTYELTYSVTDPVGNSALPVHRTVQVSDTLPPIITILGPLYQTIECGSPYVDPGAWATDICDGSLPPEPSAKVDTHQPGTYVIAYSATDSSGNTSTSPAVRIISVIDTLQPIITLNGASAMTITRGSTYEEPGANAQDQCQGSVPVEISGQVDTNVLGTYVLYYTATDDFGNVSTATRTVTVVEPQTPSLVRRTSTLAR